MKIGKMIIYNKETGKILNGCLEQRIDSGLTEKMAKELRPDEVEIVVIPYDYNENNFKEALKYHIDISKDKETTEIKDFIVIDNYIEHKETQKEKLLRDKKELENQLLIQENKILGGIL